MGSKRAINRGYWMSFENHPRLIETKRNIYARCLPCLEKLYSQLQGNPTSLSLEEPLNCWKVVVILKNFNECLDLLQKYQDEKFPVSHTVRGRVGTNDTNNPNLAVIFYVYDEKERDELVGDLHRIAAEIASNSEFSLFVERGCQDLYVSLCGDWKNWQAVTPIINPSQIERIKEKVGKLLKGEY